MRDKSVFQTFIAPAVIVIAGLAAVVFLSSFIATARPPLPEDYEDTDLTVHGSKLKGFVFGMEGLVADWYYVRSLQYIGYKVLRSKSEFVNIEDLRYLNPRLLYPFLNTAADLDPHFIAAYSYGAMVLPAIDPEKAIALAEKGIAANPSQWRIYQHLGYIYWRLKRYDKAAETYEKGSQIPGAAPFMKIMSAAMKTEGGSRSTARAIYKQMLADPQDDQVKITAERRLAELDSLDERDAIDRVLANLKERSGRCTNSLTEILPALADVHLPDNHDFRINSARQLVDPTDAPYIFDKENCRARLDPARTKLPIE